MSFQPVCFLKHGLNGTWEFDLKKNYNCLVQGFKKVQEALLVF